MDNIDDEIILEKYIELFSSENTTKWCPHTPHPKQKEFLDLKEREALYGGAAGGGKSDALLMGALEHVDKPGYAAILFRRTFADLNLAGALIPRSHEWLSGTPASWNGTDKKWTFPTGATISFGYLDTDKDRVRYQGAEFQYIGFDELTQFSEIQYKYLLSRLRRRTGVDIPLRVRSATNPGGVGHEWVFERFINPKNHNRKSFIPAKIEDNPSLDGDEYLQALEELDTVTKQQLRDGLWIQDTTGLVYKYSAERNLIQTLPKAKNWRHIWVIDFGGSQIKPTEAVAILAFNYVDKTTYVVETRKRSSRTLDEIYKEYCADKEYYGNFVATVIDQGGLGSKFGEELLERYGMPVEHADKSNKLGYRKLFNGALERGVVKIVGDKNEDLIREYTNLVWDEKGLDCAPGLPDHSSDAVLYAWRKAKSFLASPPTELPPDGSRERIELEAQLMFERHLADAVKEQNTPWWAKRKGIKGF